MIIEKTKLKDVILIKLDKFEDHRGIFEEIFNEKEYKEKGINIKFVRDCISTSGKNVLRGIHYDDKTWKLIQCLQGKFYLVVVDMQPESQQYLHWDSFSLNEYDLHQVLIPPMFGNGHLVLSNKVIFHYKMSEYYEPNNEKILKWDDPKVNINWPIKNPILSQKDANAKYL